MIQNPIPWPNGARCAVAFTFDVDAESLVHLGYRDEADNKIAALSELGYDAEIAVPRIIALYQRYGLKQTFFVPAWCLEQHPAMTDLILQDGHEIAHHGYLHENPNKLSAEEERDWLGHAIETIERTTGRRPRGYRAPSYAFSRNTAGFLIEEGFDYDASLMGDDIPYVLEHPRGRLIELPSTRQLDDWTYFVTSRDFNWMLPTLAPERAYEVYRAEFDAAWRYGGLWIAVWHPFVSARLGRIDAMDRLICDMHDRGGVWFATTEQIAQHVRAVIDAGQWVPRAQKLPYPRGPIPELTPRIGRAAE
ncbi:MAG: polysaccharide deacetylase [Alphaproteobacteria bacterium]|nr:polysaccharide deacetylase [Alphaproteobacteria bacterium]